MADKLDMDQRELMRESVETQFKEVLQGLSTDGELATFKQEYEKVFTALKQSHEYEDRLGKKVRDLTNELLNNAAKVQQALRLSEEDSATIEDLKKQLEKSFTMVETANSREEQAQMQIERMQGEVASLAGLVEKQTALLGGDLTLEDLLAQRQALVAKVNEMDEQLAYEKKRADAIASDLMHRNEKQRELKAAQKDLERRLGLKEAEEIKEAKRKQLLEADLQRTKEQLGSTGITLDQTKRALSDANAYKEKQSSQLEQQRAAMASTLAELHALQQARVKLTDEIEEKMKVIDDLSESKNRAESEQRKLKAALEAESSSKIKTEHRLGQAMKEVESLQKALEESKQEQAKLRSSLHSVEKDLNKELVTLKDTERKVTQLERGKATAEKQVEKEKQTTEQARMETDKITAELKVTEQEMGKMSAESHKLLNLVRAMERERERLLKTVEDQKSELEEHKETIRLRDAQVREAEKAETDLNIKIKSVQGMYESMRAERNSASKSLMESMDEISELKRKGKVQSNQIESLKEDVHMKDKALVAEQFEASSLSKQLTARMGEVDALKRLLDEASENNRRQEVEMKELNITIRKQDSEAVAQKRAFDSVVSERDVLAMQLQRRNDEVALLYEKVAIQANTLKAGEKEYNLRLDDIKMLKTKLAEVKRELVIASASKGGIEELKKEVIRLQKELAAEQNKVRALTEEMENPLNVHRWRKLEGADPQAFELVQKVHTLQKRLIAKTEEAVEKSLAMQEKERALAEVQARLAAVPGPELADQLTQAQALVNERTRQLKALASEVNMYQAQIAEYKYELERAAKEMMELKRHGHGHGHTHGSGMGGTAKLGSTSSTAASGKGASSTAAQQGGEGGPATTNLSSIAGSGLGASGRPGAGGAQVGLPTLQSTTPARLGGGFAFHA